jgi:2-polyprenyl-3-methyl-5-hydroxy-6-metoxy-1,4-benzoquinol methylase
MTGVMRRAILAYSARNRRRKAALVQDFIGRHGLRTSMLVGCGGAVNANDRIVEAAVADCTHVQVACDVKAPESSTTPWPFRLADGRDLPFEDQATDFILANAVIEHVGDADEQARFVQEQTRVARAWAITTPNRWFPVESHTSAVLCHWFPAWRERRPEFTRLLSRREFAAILPRGAVVHGRPWSTTFTALFIHEAAGSHRPR